MRMRSAIDHAHPADEDSVEYSMPPKRKAATMSSAGAGAEEMAQAARTASRKLVAMPTASRVAALNRIADALVAKEAAILAENAKDVKIATDTKSVPDSTLQRLKLKPGKIANLAEGIRAIANMDEPINRTLRKTQIAEGLELEQVTSPLGVLMIIFEARPDALPQIASLAIRSGNGLLLKGGKEAANSNRILHRTIVDALAASGDIDTGLIGLVESRDEIADLLKLDKYIDLVIPRGSNALVSHIQANTKIPVLGHADGVCHVYIDPACDMEKAKKIIVDSKTDYPAACNALETLLVHEALAGDGRLAELRAALEGAGVALHGGPRAAKELGLPAAADLHCEYGDNACTVEVVPSMDAAIDHIHAHGSGHTECIVTEDAAASQEFLRRVDAACVFHNASTRFADGFRFGLGAEVGISTSRIHARGPVGVDGLLTTRWLMRGSGQVVAKDTGIKYTHAPIPF